MERLRVEGEALFGGEEITQGTELLVVGLLPLVAKSFGCQNHVLFTSSAEGKKPLKTSRCNEKRYEGTIGIMKSPCKSASLQNDF